MTPVIGALCLVAMPLTAMAESQAAGHALLQKAQQQQQQEQMMNQVQSMISDVVAKKRMLSPAEETAIDLMISSLKDTTIPAVHKGHSDEQKIVNSAYNTLVACNTKLSEDGTAAEKLATGSSGKFDAHGTCRAKEGELATANVTAYEALASFVMNLGSEPQKPSGILGLSSWFNESLSWFKSNKELYSEKKGAYLQASSDWSSKKGECDGAEVDFESAVCAWHAKAHESISHHTDCWKDGLTTFKAVTSAAEDSATQRKAEFQAASKLLCFLAILNDLITTKTVPDGIDASLVNCSNLDPNTDFLLLENTTEPTKSVAQFTVQLGGESVVLPGGNISGVTCGDGEVPNEPPTATTEAPMSTTEAPPSFTETPEPSPAPLAAKVVVEGDYETVVTDKSKFLEECSATLAPVKCVDVHPGSIVVEVDSDSGSSTAAEDLQTAVTNLRTNDLVLPSFGKLPVQSVEVDTDTTYDTDTPYDTDTVYDIE
eukprot:TRINITY_DN1621_c0_g1_i9.p1 TRINITY_DN1621_c0_g1~~TRINITY_DN1621_c0_g1_i9.p1  ORF type:complete len:486 (-),score=114.25 TRINITY_DN1621_c0_g1_i9:274-1731(-)